MPVRMSNMRAVVTVAVPAVTAFLGFLWYSKYRKQPEPRRHVEPTCKKDRESPQAGEDDSVSESNSPVNVTKLECSENQILNTGTQLEEQNSVLSPTEKGDNVALNTAGINLNLTTSSDVTEEIIEQIIVEKDSIQESAVKPSNDHCRFVEKVEVKNEAISNSPSIEMDATSSHDSEELETFVKKYENVPTDLGCSSPAADLSISTGKVEDKIEIRTVGELSSSPSSMAADNTGTLQAETSDDRTETGHLTTESEDGSKSCDEFDKEKTPCEKSDDRTELGHSTSEYKDVSEEKSERRKTQEVDAVTCNWHEEVMANENMADLTESVSTDLHNKPGTNENHNTDLANNEKCKSNNEYSTNKKPVLNSRTDDDLILENTKSNSSSIISQANEKLPNNNNLSDVSSNCENLSQVSSDSEQGGNVKGNGSTLPQKDCMFEFNIPSDLCGMFIGTRGKTIKMISQQSGTKIRLQNNPYARNFQICTIEGSKIGIEVACDVIKKKLPAIKFPGMDTTPSANPVIIPEIMQLSLPDGVSVDVVVSSIVDAGRLFVQQPTHPSYPSLDRLNTFMNQCYMQDGAVPDVPQPIESGVICAAPMLNGWYRAQIMATCDGSDECDIKYVDYGGYSRVSCSLLKQIRSDFMTLPFEAVECYLANIAPLENEEFFSTEAAVVLEELTQGKLLQGQVVGHAEDGLPYVQVYQILGVSSAVLVNREMVNRGVVRWIELMK